MDSSNKAARLSLGESFVMLAMFTILGVMIIKFDMSPQILLFVFTLVMFYSHEAFSWDEIFNGVSEGVTPGIIPI